VRDIKCVEDINMLFETIKKLDDDDDDDDDDNDDYIG
jgi:hypothetical protein